MRNTLASCLLLLLSAAPGASLSCLDSAGGAVDYWFGLKSSGCANTSSPLCSFYASFPPAFPSSGSLPFSSSLAGAASALGATLSALAAARLSNSTAALHWNDAPPPRFLPLPSTVGSFNAHSKGILAADGGGGMWLTHSWPEFADVPAFAPAWGIGEASTTNGQSFLCVSLPLPQVERLAAALLRMEPRVYDAVVPLNLRSALPALSALAGGARNKSFPLPTVTALTSAGGLGFLHVSKNGAWGGELYSEAVLPALNATGLWVETWRRPPMLGTICGANGSAINVMSLNVTEGSGARPALQSYTTDHSKWAVSVCPALAEAGAGFAADGSRGPGACPADFKRWVCVGDINMMTSQNSRGGGTVCFDHSPDLWAALVGAVAAVDTCNASASGALAAGNSSGTGNSSTSVGNSSSGASSTFSASASVAIASTIASSASVAVASSASAIIASSARASSTSTIASSTTASIASTSTSSGSCSPSPSPPSPAQLAQQQGRQSSSEQALPSAAASIGYACAAAAVLGAAAFSLARARRLRAAKGRLTAASAAARGALRPSRAQWRVRELLV